jgi:hypothetical protein
MELLKLKTIYEVPPGGFFWIDPVTKVESKAGDFDSLLRMARAHRLANKIEIPADFNAIIEDNICKRCPPNFVKDSPSKQTSYIATSDVIAKTQTLMRLAKTHGKMLCQPEEAALRSAICVQCPMNVRIMCPTCNGVLDWMRTNWHLPALPLDNRLVVCRHGHILNKAQVHLSAEIIRSLLPAATAALYPPTCWKRKLVLEKPDEPNSL